MTTSWWGSPSCPRWPAMSAGSSCGSSVLRWARWCYYCDNIVILSRYFIIIMIILSSSQDISHFNEELWSHNFRHSSSADLHDGTFCCGFGIFRILSPLYKTFICRVNKKRCFPSSFLVVLVHLVLLLQALVNCNLDFNRDWLGKTILVPETKGSAISESADDTIKLVKQFKYFQWKTWA